MDVRELLVAASNVNGYVSSFENAYCAIELLQLNFNDTCETTKTSTCDMCLMECKCDVETRGVVRSFLPTDG